MENWLLQFGSIAAILLTVLKVWDLLRAKPPIHETYATKGELAALARDLRKLAEASNEENQRLHDRISAQRDEMSRQLTAGREAGEIRAERILKEIADQAKETRSEIHGLHRRLDDTRQVVARIEGELSKPH